jgi:hypothetical protein
MFRLIRTIQRTDRNEEDGSIDIHACECCDDGASTQKQLTADQDIGDECKDHEDQVRYASISRVDDLEVGMASWRILLDLARQDGKQQDLDGGTSCVPKRTRNTISIRNLVNLSIVETTQPTAGLTVLDCSSVAAHVHAETIPEAISPGLTERDAVLNSSDCFVEYGV